VKTKSKTDPEIPLLPLELPLIARHYFQPERVDKFCYALSDLLCWMDGFKAAGGQYSPGSIEVIRDLSCNLKTIQEIQNKK
jgi:hypothetical protein